MNSPISWKGGKKALLKYILPRFPAFYTQYIEVFGGGGWVLFAKPPKKDDVYNDYNKHLSNLFTCMKQRPVELVKELGFLPLNARDDFFVLRKFLQKEEFDDTYMKEQMKLAEYYLPPLEAHEIKTILAEEATMFNTVQAAAMYNEVHDESPFSDFLDSDIPISESKNIETVEDTEIGDNTSVQPQTHFTDKTEETHDYYSDEYDRHEHDRSVSYNANWTGRYKKARKYFFGSEDTEPDFDKAYNLFIEEAETGNALAMHDLGRMYMDGLGRKIDTSIAQEWHTKALLAFMNVESRKPKPYTKYRIGKMHYAGFGTPQNYEKAAEWFGMADNKNHKYAQYSLAGMYYMGHGVNQDYSKAFELYTKSALQDNAYASYELAKMYHDGIGTLKDEANADKHFKIAFIGFVSMEKESKDDKLQYRIGQMLLNGKGTEQNTQEAIKYFEKSAKLGNVYAQYSLAKIYLDSGDENENIQKALNWMSEAANNGNQLAQYFFGNLYLTGKHLKKDAAKAAVLFIQAAEQGNQFAQYALGKLYLTGEDILKDRAAAVYWLSLSAAQGNIYAKFLLKHMDDKYNPSVLLSTTRLLHHLGHIFDDKARFISNVSSKNKKV